MQYSTDPNSNRTATLALATMLLSASIGACTPADPSSTASVATPSAAAQPTQAPQSAQPEELHSDDPVVAAADTAQEPAVVAQAPATEAQPVRSEVAAASPLVRAQGGKAVAPVALDYRLAREVQPGETVTLDLVLTPTAKVEGLEISVNVSSGLNLLDAAADQVFRADRVDEPFQRSFLLQASSAGLHYVNVIAAVQTAEGRRVRTYALPLQAGSVAIPLESKASTESSSESVVSMPAVETP